VADETKDPDHRVFVRSRPLSPYASMQLGIAEHEAELQKERDEIADRLRRLANEHDQRAVYFLSYDADFLREVADRISPLSHDSETK